MSSPDAFVLKKLRREGWPDESLDCYEKTGSRVAVLYPFMRGPVSTPDGPGTLLAAIGGVATVLLDSEAGGEPTDSVEVEAKECVRCGPVEGPKPLDAFQVHGQNGKRYKVCKACVTKANREARRRKNEPEPEPPEPVKLVGSGEVFLRAETERVEEVSSAPSAIIDDGAGRRVVGEVGHYEDRPEDTYAVLKDPVPLQPAAEDPEPVEARIPPSFVDNPALSDNPAREPYVDEMGRRRCANRNRCVMAMGFEEGDREPAVLKQDSPHLICRGCRKGAGQIG